MARTLTTPDLSFLTLPRYETQDLMREVVLPGGDGVCSSDWHLPIVSEATVLSLIQNARKRKATDWLVIAGDFFNFDALSDYMPKQGGDHGLMDEIQMSRKLMRILLGVFDEVYVSLGNHDDRILRKLGFTMRFEQSMSLCIGNLPDKMADKLKFSNRDYVIIKSDEGPWRVCHTRQYAMRQLHIPSDIADIYQMNVLAGHRHHHALGYSKGGFRIGELGWLGDEEKTCYIKRWTSTHPRMQQGYVILKDGRPIAPLLHS